MTQNTTSKAEPPSAEEVHAHLRQLKIMLHTLRVKETELVRRLIARSQPVPEVLSDAAQRLRKGRQKTKRLKSA